MTDLHARLLAELDRPRLRIDDCSCSSSPERAALRAVVELHQPVQGVRLTCSACTSGMTARSGSYVRRDKSWPCSTITAIATHLGIDSTPEAPHG